MMVAGDRQQCRRARSAAVALGRKNYLFAGSDAGGERASAIYSLIATAKLNDRDPKTYLRTVLSKIADHPVNQIAELLPWKLDANGELWCDYWPGSECCGLITTVTFPT
jgi:hypothetical protein